MVSTKEQNVEPKNGFARSLPFILKNIRPCLFSFSMKFHLTPDSYEKNDLYHSCTRAGLCALRYGKGRDSLQPRPDCMEFFLSVFERQFGLQLGSSACSGHLFGGRTACHGCYRCCTRALHYTLCPCLLFLRGLRIELWWIRDVCWAPGVV